MNVASVPKQSIAAQLSPAAGTPLQQSECQALKRMADCLHDVASKGCLPFQPGQAAQDALQHFTNQSTHEVWTSQSARDALKSKRALAVVRLFGVALQTSDQIYAFSILML